MHGLPNLKIQFCVTQYFSNEVKYETQHYLKSNMSVDIKRYKQNLGGFWCASSGLHV